jgi:hypothetical protein
MDPTNTIGKAKRGDIQVLDSGDMVDPFQESAIILIFIAYHGV